MSRLVVLAGLVMALALALPDSAEAATFNEVKKLTASDAQAGDEFGLSVAVSGDTAVVGAAGQGAGGDSAGAAYVLQRNEGGADNWGEVTKLTASDAQAQDEFGRNVAVSGDTIVVGAWGEDANGSSAGAAYIFQRDEGGSNNWGEVKKLTASDAQASDSFGFSLAVSGNTIVVGADSEDAGGTNAGAAYVFQRNEGGANQWGEVKKLTASDAQAFAVFGIRVAVSGDTAVVGSFTGAAYVFQRDWGGASNWGEVTKLTASGDVFGFSVAVSGDTAVVGSFGGTPPYVFQRNEGGAENWGMVKKLLGSDTTAGDFIGFSVAVSGDTAVVGAHGEDTGGTFAGAAYVFERGEGGADNWGQVEKLTASDAEAGDGFGLGVGVSGDTAVVGAWHEDAEGENAGAAYVFDLLGAKVTPTTTSTKTLTVTPTPTITPTPTLPPGVGGMALDSELRGLPLESAADLEASRWVAIAAVFSAASLAASGAAWYTKRRWLA